MHGPLQMARCNSHNRPIEISLVFKLISGGCTGRWSGPHVRPPLAPLGEPLAQRVYVAPLFLANRATAQGDPQSAACSQIIPTDACVQFRIGFPRYAGVEDELG
jgi:hypothetical protein